MKHNNQIPSNHFRKHWQRRVKTWFDQAGKKKSRRLARAKKAAECGARPTSLLKPAVRCPTLKYNIKVRAGRGFTLDELKAAGITARYARTIGIAVDHRRKNRSEESLALNKERLGQYLSKLQVLPRNKKPSEGSSSASMAVFAVKNAEKKFGVETLTDALKNASVYSTLRKAWETKRYAGIRAKREAAKAEEAAQSVKAK